MRETEEWIYGDVLLVCAQASFAPILLQKMEQPIDRVAMVNQKINTTKEIMAENIDMALARKERLEDMQERSEELNAMAKQFKKRAKQVKRYKMIQNTEHGALIGGLVVTATVVVVVSPLVALL
ncbi:hypothetical protein CTEN210_14082 [Chaetoceros tenuissimus]|uniref:V-SNARE coiled-coil homology domain-containing protein n=1 Tax=Chaetoceros tenuissimus TaxID=426638 RepID=A0AAD3D6J2_9STRA|nr:hypothetical protein CTEN210_01059 [Chaetoceros tenuissimus]GFH46634.1 hypothetical protein CTEN210_03108 [Chaetoceros tenuissimus]GFH48519.1 hypothetical protein CTEN210_04995 [Chaetoceros tenuissimus]GFH52508.1 hypothetical protein CTEN210_08984 [Chaetoceros tenuissimus]GFH57606.1 hypothetical protein CTEN210_14082 [Chaetoceros tenuissimus]